MNSDLTTNQLDEICLSTVYFFEGDAPPSTIRLNDCSLMLDGQTVICGLYGHQSRVDGFIAASEYASKNNLQYTVIDFYIQGKINPKQMKKKDLTAFDFFFFSRASKEVILDVAQLVSDFLEEGDEDVSILEQMKPQLLLSIRHDLMLKLLGSETFRPFKMVAGSFMFKKFNQQLTVGIIQKMHWGEIVKANCRLHPTVRVVV